MVSNETQLFEKMNHLFNVLGEYKSRIFSISVNSYDFEMLNNHPEFDKLFTFESNLNGEDFLNGVLLFRSPLIASGTFYLKQKNQ